MEYKGESCVICGGQPAAWHHIFYGTANRKLSDKYGYIVALCPEHHAIVHGNPNKGIDATLKRAAQIDFETSRSRSDFISIFGRNYL